MSPREQSQEFFSRHGMAWQEMDVNALISRFQQQMDAGLAGKESSLAMIPTWIETDLEIPAGRKVIVLDAGGTNLRVAYFDQLRARLDVLIVKSRPMSFTRRFATT